MGLELNSMVWIILWLYIIGTLNEFLFAMSVNVDIDRWQSHLLIALWPITVPASMLLAGYEFLTGKND